MAGTVPGIAPTGSVSMDTEAAGGTADTGTAGAGTAMDTDTGVDVGTDAGTIATAAIISRLDAKSPQRRTWTKAPISGWSR